MNIQTHPTHSAELLDVVRQILGTVVEAIPPAAPSALYVAPERRLPPAPAHPMRRATDAPIVVAPARPTVAAKKTGAKAVVGHYRPRVAYHPTHKSPSVRKPLPDTDAAVYAAVLASPGITAKPLQSRLKLRDGQLWGAIRRLTTHRLIRTVRPSAA